VLNCIAEDPELSPDLTKVLLGAGADVTLKASGRRSILEYIDNIDSPEVRDILRDHTKYENKPDCRPQN
jgi:hypothetical protein